MRCVRIWFSKQGRVKYVSHLDIMRCMTRAVRRANIPLWYTEGFNPHPYLNFLQPMPLGVEGLNEPLDIRIEDEITDADIMASLNNVLPVGIKVTRVTEPYMKSNDLAFAEYEIYFEKEENLVSKLDNAMQSGELVCEKMGKVNGRKRVKEVNVSENIKKYSLSENDDAVIMNVVLPGGNTKNVNPMNLLDALNKYLESDIVPLNIVRLRLLDDKLIPFE
ncbi:MAG: TIGR03936 family radical SAM-associated protein [Clostridia bacterium]|nr:TIGR03936 family radical SAM-associated protein [Clostridia bacterium]